MILTIFERLLNLLNDC